jgi:cellulose synthase/poly-beta-1,6-N-acetylglucosamine synthase-like glycosyltransferase
MLLLASAALCLLAGLLSVPAVTLFIELSVSRKPPPHEPSEIWSKASCGQAAIIVPAHNESVGILPTLNDLKLQLQLNDRLIVVADNCSDDTETVATLAGAEVIARHEPANIGKGYALAHGLAYLKDNSPEFVVFIDADCRIQHDMIARLKLACVKFETPMQACFLMVAAENSSVDHALSEFAWIVKNWARPLGLYRLGLPVQLMGSGMIFPWKLISRMVVATDNLVEDMKLGLDLAAAGHAPQFYPQVVGSSEFPISKNGSYSQRQRWIQGHLGMIRGAPKLLIKALLNRNWRLLAMVIDLTVPPLSLFVFLLLATLSASLATALMGGGITALAISSANALIVGSAIYLAWTKFGSEAGSSTGAARVFAQLWHKLAFYSKVYLGKRAVSWTRTERSKRANTDCRRSGSLPR